jgi:BNR repeat-like domain
MSWQKIATLLLISSAACSRVDTPALDEVSTPAQPELRESADPAIAADPANGDLLLAWVAGDSSGYNLYFARSGDQGAHWSTPARVTTDSHEIKPHAEASPRLVAGKSALALIWPSHIDVQGRRFPASHMRFSRSTDGGRTWSQPITLNDDTTAVLAGHTFHGATAIGDSTLLVAWLDSRVGAQPHLMEGDTAVHHDGDATIYTAVSHDFGKTWSATNEKHWRGACPCCRVSLAATREGQVLAAWRGHFPGNVRDPVVAQIGSAQEPMRVHTDGWVLEGCPHSGPAVALDANDRAHIAWYTGRPGHAGVYYARQDGAGKFGEPVAIVSGDVLPVAHPVMALLNDRALLALNLDEKGERNLTIVHVSADGGVTRSTVAQTKGADHPQIAATSSGAVVAWTEKTGNAMRVRVGLVR